MVIEFKQPRRSERQILLNAAKRVIQKHLKPEGMNTEDIIKVLTPFLIYIKKYGAGVTGNSLRKSHDFISLLLTLLGKLTPREIMTYYPITKDFTAERYELKGYRHTIEYINTLDKDRPIAASADTAEQVISFIWEYQNPYIRALGVAHMIALDTFQELAGKPTFEEIMYYGSLINPAPQFEIIKGGK